MVFSVKDDEDDEKSAPLRRFLALTSASGVLMGWCGAVWA